MLQLKNYDMRRFTIKDKNDVEAFFGMIEKGIPAVRRYIHGLQTKNAAQASVINSQKRTLEARPQMPITKPEEIDGNIIQTVSPEQVDLTIEKEAILKELRAVNERQKERAKELEKNATPDEKLRKGVPDDIEVIDKRMVVKGDFGVKMITRRNGKETPSWTYKGVLTKEGNVPSDLRPRLLDALKQVVANNSAMMVENISASDNTPIDDISVEVEPEMDVLEEDDNADSSFEQ